MQVNTFLSCRYFCVPITQSLSAVLEFPSLFSIWDLPSMLEEAGMPVTLCIMGFVVLRLQCKLSNQKRNV